MICIHHQNCNSSVCPHRLPHDANDFCTGGSCSWGKDTHCVPESKQEMLETLMSAHFPKDAVPGIVRQIMGIFGEAA